MAEIYKIIEGFENYSVSDHGNVKSNKSNKTLKPYLRNQYYAVKLYINNIDFKTIPVHRLVALSFIENIEDKKVVDHINNDKLNNTLINLRWATNTQNSQNSIIYTNNTSGSKGVTFSNALNKWASRLDINGIRVHLGYFTDKQDAINARIQKANEAFGIYTNKCEKIINV